MKGGEVQYCMYCTKGTTQRYPVRTCAAPQTADGSGALDDYSGTGGSALERAVLFFIVTGFAAVGHISSSDRRPVRVHTAM